MIQFWQWLRCTLTHTCTPQVSSHHDALTHELQQRADQANRRADVLQQARREGRRPTLDEFVRAGGITREAALGDLWGRAPWEDNDDAAGRS